MNHSNPTAQNSAIHKNMLLLTYPTQEELLMRAADRMIEWLDGGPACPVELPKN